MGTRRKIAVGMATLTAVLIVGCASSTDTPDAQPETTTTRSEPATPQVADEPEDTTPPPEPELTVSQEQAIAAAQSYLDMGGFSKAGLIDQLSSSYGEGFPKADAKFAVEYLDPN